MRILICSTLTLMLANGASADPQRGLFESRGFLPGKCYQHLGVRHCKKAAQPTCSLEVFPDRTAALFFPIQVNGKQRMDLDEDADDFGIYKFRVSKLEHDSPSIEIIGVERISLQDFDSKQEASATAHVVPCK